MQHAHQKGIIHRDLKPSNILVASQDGTHMPKVIDFGIAKAIEDPLTDYTLLTRAGQFIGTPDYMSPEQAGVLDVDVDTRTDVYALGVVLYELLSGRRPHQFERRTQDEVQEVLREQDARAAEHVPVHPRRLLRGRRRRSTRRRWRASPRAAAPRAIVCAVSSPAISTTSSSRRCRRSRRAATARSSSSPTICSAISMASRCWRGRTRGRIARASSCGATRSASASRRPRSLMLVTFAVVMAVQSARIARERDRALAAEQRARTEAETAQQVSNFLTGLFRISDPNNSRGETITAREILDRGAKRIGDDLGDKPAVQGRLLHTLGSVYKQLGMYDEAATLMTQSVAAREKADPELLEESLNELGDIERYRGRIAEAEPILRRALELRRKKFGGAHTKVAQTLNNLALVFDEQGKFERIGSDAPRGAAHPARARSEGSGRLEQPEQSRDHTASQRQVRRSRDGAARSAGAAA